MLRVLAFIILIFLISAGIAWLADRPGEIVLTWQGYEVKTSLMVAALGIAAALVALVVVIGLLRALIRAPRAFEAYLGQRKKDRGYRALSDGLVAVGAGDARTARKSARDAQTLLGQEPMPLLLTAQAAQLAGDRDGARNAYQALSERTDTKVLGLHGLFEEAQSEDQHEAAQHFAHQAFEAAPKIGWAGMALYEYQSRSGAWLEAMRTLESNLRNKVIDKSTAQAKRAVLQTARAMEIEGSDPKEARAAALEAHRLAPSLAPASVVASRLLTRNGDYRRAARVLEETWREMPHPAIAETYANVRPGDSVRDRLKRMRRLADLRANHPEGAKALARAAIDARDFAAARAALEGAVKAGPSESVCLLMAEIEEREHGDQGKLRMWLARALAAPRDPAWFADGQVFEEWRPVSPSGVVGGLEWKVPPEAPPSRLVMDIEAELAAAEASALAAAEPMDRIEAQPVAEFAEPEETESPSEEQTSTEPEPDIVDVTPVNSPEIDKPAHGPEEAAEPHEELAAAPDSPESPSLLLSDPPSAEPENPEPENAPIVATAADPAVVEDVKTTEHAPETEPEIAEAGAAKTNGVASPVVAEAPTAEAAESAEELAAEAEPDGSTIPPPPDDPGPVAEDDDEGTGTRRRFRLFG